MGLSANPRYGPYDTLIDKIQIKDDIQNNARGANCEGNA
jgi:hypothetical protein